MRRVLFRALLATAALLVAAILTVWFALRASLPELDGEIATAGVVQAASIVRDADGIPTITASNRNDLAFATGYAHGQDRFFQMDLIRREAAGELSALFGPSTIDMDKRNRFHQFRRRAREALRTLSAAERALIDAYVNGVNAGVTDLGARPPEYWLLRQLPEPWQAEDTLLAVYAMFLQLNDSRAHKDVRRGYANEALTPDLYKWMYPPGTSWDAPIVGDAIEPPPLPFSDSIDLRRIAGRRGPAMEQSLPPLNGSNNWAVSGALTTNGAALVSNDMHLGLSVPNIWYRARLVTTGDAPRDVTGVSLPGTPFVVAGSNGHIAWGYTNSYGDWSDAVIVRPGSSEGTYRTADGDEPFEAHDETIAVAGAESVDYRIRTTRWGPIDDRLRFGESEIAVNWLAHKREAINLGILGFETALTVDEALDIGNRIGMPPQNLVVGDRDGAIGWTIAGRIPLRSDYDPMLPADWSDEDGWQGWLAPDDYPRLVNPASGRIWTANARVVGGAALNLIGDGGYDLGARAGQIRDALFDDNQFTPEDMLAIQRDSRARFLSRWREVLLRATENEPDLAEYRQLVKDWIPAAVPDSVGYRLVRAFRLQTRYRLFLSLTGPVEDRFGPDAEALLSEQFEAALWDMVTQQPAHLLPPDYPNWDAFLADVVRETQKSYREDYPGPLGDRTWGELNTARIAHPVSQALPFLSGWLDMPAVGLPGDENLPLAQGRRFGASERFSVSPGDEAAGLMHMPAGQSGHPLSRFYRRGHDAWANGEATPFLPGPAAHRLSLVPDRAISAPD